MRVCWNRQTGTFEGRVSLTYGFKSRLPHQWENPYKQSVYTGFSYALKLENNTLNNTLLFFGGNQIGKNCVQFGGNFLVFAIDCVTVNTESVHIL